MTMMRQHLLRAYLASDLTKSVNILRVFDNTLRQSNFAVVISVVSSSLH